MKKLLVILLMIMPSISFAEEPIYFKCKLTCLFSTFKGENQPMDGCEWTYKGKKRLSTRQHTYKYFKDTQELYHHGLKHQCEDNRENSRMQCFSSLGAKSDNPVSTGDWLNENLIKIGRLSLRITTKTNIQVSEDSQLHEEEYYGECEIVKPKF
jgi:hypothetical protein